MNVNLKKLDFSFLGLDYSIKLSKYCSCSLVIIYSVSDQEPFDSPPFQGLTDLKHDGKGQ